MESTISPEVQADERLREAVVRADAELRQVLRTPAEGRTWAWSLAARNEPAAVLTVAYEGNTSSRTFTLAELNQAGEVGWEGRSLWEDVLMANIRRTRDRILELVREFKAEEALQEA